MNVDNQYVFQLFIYIDFLLKRTTSGYVKHLGLMSKLVEDEQFKPQDVETVTTIRDTLHEPKLVDFALSQTVAVVEVDSLVITTSHHR